MIKYKGELYQIGNEYHGIIELYSEGELKYLVKRRKNGTYFKWYDR